METKFENGTEITSYLATAYAEGFCEGGEASDTDIIKAWSYLIGTGQCYKLQGWFGRNAQSIIEKGIINSDGNVDWEIVEDLIQDYDF